jgi:hypothetical protein
MENRDQRLKRLEMALTPRQQVTAYILRSLRRSDSRREHSIWYLTDPAGESDLRQIFEQVTESVLKKLNGQQRPKNEIKPALNDAYREIEWHRRLFDKVNARVERQLEDTLPLYYWLWGWLQHMFLANHRDALQWPFLYLGRRVGRVFYTESLPPAFNEELRRDSERQHANWEQTARTLIKTLYAIRIAHEQIAAAYFEGHPILWKDTREVLDHRLGDHLKTGHT